MKYVLLFLILLPYKLPATAEKAQTSDMILSFLKAVSNNSNDSDCIIKKYICYNGIEGDKKKSQEAYELLKMQVDALRPLVQGHSIDSLSIIPYQNLAKDEQLIMTDDTSIQDIYVVKDGTEKIMSILIKNQKIASFITMVKGKQEIFILFC